MGTVVLQGASSGATTLTPTDGVTATITLPSTSGTLALAGPVNVTASNLPTGSIIQVVTNSSNPGASYTTSSTFSSTGLYATITPLSTSSRILMIATSRNVYPQSGGLQVQLWRGTSGNGSGSNIAQLGNSSSVGGAFYLGGTLTFLDSPASTSALTYTIMNASTNNSSLVGFIGEFTGISTITLLEIK